MIRLIYNLLFPFALLIFLPRYLWKMRRRGDYRRNFGQRFAIYSAETRARLAAHPLTWIHAVSVGEVAIALKLATKLHELELSFECVLTTTTTTGHSFAEKNAPRWMQVMYNPLDFWPIMQWAFAAIRPIRVVLVEAEVWPNLAAGARTRGIPLSLVNARLSPQSERRFQRFRFFVEPTFRCLDLVCVQETEDVERCAGIGVPQHVIQQVGSIKYDPAESSPDSNLPRASLDTLEGRPVLFGGSTHAGEEEILGNVFLRLRAEFPKLLLFIAPRHVERTPQIRDTLERLGLAVAVRSQLREGEATPSDCLLLDTTGELRSWYAIATVVFMGKSLTARGGQNPVEPILAGKPVIFGPHMENFAVLSRSLLLHKAALEISHSDALEQGVIRLLRDANLRQQLIENALRVLAPHRGATQRTAERVLAAKSQAKVRV